VPQQTARVTITVRRLGIKKQARRSLNTSGQYRQAPEELKVNSRGRQPTDQITQARSTPQSRMVPPFLYRRFHLRLFTFGLSEANRMVCPDAHRSLRAARVGLPKLSRRDACATACKMPVPSALDLWLNELMKIATVCWHAPALWSVGCLAVFVVLLPASAQ